MRKPAGGIVPGVSQTVANTWGEFAARTHVHRVGAGVDATTVVPFSDRPAYWGWAGIDYPETADYCHLTGSGNPEKIS